MTERFTPEQKMRERVERVLRARDELDRDHFAAVLINALTEEREKLTKLREWLCSAEVQQNYNASISKMARVTLAKLDALEGTDGK